MRIDSRASRDAATVEPAAPGLRAPLRLWWRERELAVVSLLEATCLLGADRPDLLAMRLVDHEPYFTPPVDCLPQPDEPLRLGDGRRILFQGRVERLDLEALSAEPPTATVHACAVYHFLRASFRAREYVSVTLADLAWEIALGLGLEPRIECPEIVVPDVRLEGDPLPLLRRRARAAGLELAVREGALYLCPASALPGAAHVVTPASEVTGVTVRIGRADGAAWERVVTGEIALLGVADIRPLDTVRLQGFGGCRDGVFRAWRCRFHVGVAGWRTTVELRGCARGAGRRAPR